MSKLSPPTKAVNDAYFNYALKNEQSFVTDRNALAAALKAAADHIYHDWSTFECIDYLYGIAAELELKKIEA